VAGWLASLALGAAALVCAPRPGSADPHARPPMLWGVSELRLAALKQDLEKSRVERGAAIGAEVLFSRLPGHYERAWLQALLTPRPHIGFLINSSGDTNRYFAGLSWELRLPGAWFLETTFGGVVHDGPLHDPYRGSFGCKLNFRESVSVGVDLAQRWRLMATIEHMSNAELCIENAGLTSLGARLGLKLD
jgi:hypothetical protein